jgi:hypothetical protein
MLAEPWLATKKLSKFMQLALPIAALFILFGLSGGTWHLWSAHHLAVAPAGRYLIIPGLILLALSIGHKVITKRRPLISLDELSHLLRLADQAIFAFSRSRHSRRALARRAYRAGAFEERMEARAADTPDTRVTPRNVVLLPQI